MKIALLSKYTRLGASTRIRSLQYLNSFKKNNHEIFHYPLFDDKYLNNLYTNKKKSLLKLTVLYIKRIIVMHGLKNVDLIWIEKEALPYIPYMVEKFFMPQHIPYIVDYDDAVYHNYDLSNRRYVRSLLGEKINHVMHNASVVICGNNYLKEKAIDAKSKNIKYIPTVVSLENYNPSDIVRDNDIIVIGWIGTPYTQKYMLDLVPVFKKLSTKYNILIKLIGADQTIDKYFDNIPLSIVAWSEENEASLIDSFDIGIMPLPDQPFERGKCGYKLIQYMAMEKPVIASPVGVNVEIINKFECGFLASNNSQWISSFEKIIQSETLRLEMGRRGRLAVEKFFCVQAQEENLIQTIEQAIQD